MVVASGAKLAIESAVSSVAFELTHNCTAWAVLPSARNASTSRTCSKRGVRAFVKRETGEKKRGMNTFQWWGGLPISFPVQDSAPRDMQSAASSRYRAAIGSAATPDGCDNVIFASGQHEQADACAEADQYGHDRRLRAERAAGEQFGSAEPADQQALCLAARRAGAEDARLGEIPGEMQADRQPETARIHVGGSQQHAGF